MGISTLCTTANGGNANSHIDLVDLEKTYEKISRSITTKFDLSSKKFLLELIRIMLLKAS